MGTSLACGRSTPLGLILPLAGLFAALGSSCKGPGTPDPPELQRPRAGIVVAEQPLAVEVGRRVLEQGGNAADAAVATALMLAVVHPQAGNLGGGGFALWVPHVGDGEVVDFREVAPRGYQADLYLDGEGAVVGRRSLETSLAVGVPGSPAGLHALWERHGSGRFSFAALASPAIAAAREGFAVGSYLARDLASNGPGGRIAADPAARARFHRASGGPLQEGDLLVQEDLAQTLERLASEGPRGFYEGRTAELLLRTLAEVDSREGDLAGERLMDAADLAAYEPTPRAPLKGWFRGYEVLSVPPPSSGGFVLLQVLSILDGLPLEAERTPDGVPTARALHWWIEAMRLAFADRTEHLGDPEPFHDPAEPGATRTLEVPMESLLGAEWIASRRLAIGERADPAVAPWAPTPPPESPETTHLSVLDAEGNAVSLTTTLNGTFGSGILVEGAGFLLNNELDDFSIQAGTPNMFGLVGSVANQLHGGRRPLSSMTPTVVREGGQRVVLVLGAPGGPRIITSVLQVLLRVLVHGQSLEEAVAAPRVHQQWRPEGTATETALDAGVREALVATHGHPLRSGSAAGLVQAIHVDGEGTPTGASDPRSDGAVGVTGAGIVSSDR